VITVDLLSRPGGGAAGWALQIKQRCDLSKGKMRDAIRAFATGLTNTWIGLTPVETTWMKGHYYAVLDSSIPPEEPRPQDKREARAGGGGDKSRARLAPVIAQFDLGHTITFWNSAPYAVSVEYGTASMSPRAWTRKTVALAPSLLAQAVSGRPVTAAAD
jgi:hypothetical protein